MKIQIAPAKAIAVAAFLLGFLGLDSLQAQFHNVGVFRVQILLPARMLVPGSGPAYDSIARKTLRNNDIINLTLGRPLGTRVNKTTEILAAEVTFETHGDPPQSRLIIYDKSQNGAAGVVAVVGTLDFLEWQNAYLRTNNSGFGIGNGTILATSVGNPSENGFMESTLQGGGNCFGRHLYIVSDERAMPRGAVGLQGHLVFVYTDKKGTHNFDGFVVGGRGRIMGRPLGGW